MNNRKRKWIVIVALIALIMLTTIISVIYINITNEIAERQLYAMESTSVMPIDALPDITTTGEKAKIKEVTIKSISTGMAPFDGDDSPGNDASETNDIVRSFDQISWDIMVSMAMKEGIAENKCEGGTIELKIELPEECAHVVEWQLDSMQWGQNAQISEDKKTFTIQLRMPDNTIIPGIQTIVPVLKVNNAKNGMKIQPKFTFKLLGNVEGDELVVNEAESGNKPITVSAKPTYNIQLKKNTYVNYKSKFNLTNGKEVISAQEQETTPEGQGAVQGDDDTVINGRLQGYGITVQLYNTDSSKGLKGLEFPSGDIKFDIEFNEKIADAIVNNNEGYMPTLWDYKGNNLENTGKNGRWMYWNENTRYRVSVGSAPYNTNPYPKSTVPRQDYCYNGGDWNIEQDVENKNIYHVTISNYEFDTEKFTFPLRDCDDAESIIKYGENIGCISSGYIQVILQFLETDHENESIELETTVKNLNANTLSGQSAGQDVNALDDQIKESVTLNPKGSFAKSNLLMHKDAVKDGKIQINHNSEYNLSPTKTRGDTYMMKEDNFIIVGVANITQTERKVNAINILQKFDDKAFVPIEGSDSSSGILQVTGTGGIPGTLKVLYAAKPDKTGWGGEVNDEWTQEKADDEMQLAREDDLIYFTSIAELEGAGYKCVGVLFENRNATYLSGLIGYFGIRVQEKDTAEIGKVYQTVNDICIWEMDKGIEDTFNFTWEGQRYEYTEGDSGVKELTYPDLEYPEPSFTRRNGVSGEAGKYRKTQYDTDGNITLDHSSMANGNSVLVIGAKQTVTREIVREDVREEEKYNFDLSNNLPIATYKVSIKVSNDLPYEGIGGVKLKLTDTLPEGLLYVDGSATYEGADLESPPTKAAIVKTEPDVTRNEDGTSTLVWNIENYTVNADIPAIIYSVRIDEQTKTNTHYIVESVVEEVIPDGETSKIGNCRKEERTSVTDILIINLQSYSLFKTSETPEIQVNGDMQYKLTIINKTDTAMENVNLLDILPYNGDDRETSMNGTYTVKKIVLKQTKNNEQDVLENTNLSLYTSSEESARQTNVMEDEISGETNIWKNVPNSGDEINEKLTAYVVKGNIDARVKLEIDVYMETNGNKINDLYVNSAIAQITVPQADGEKAKMSLGPSLASVIVKYIEPVQTLEKDGTQTIMSKDEEINYSIQYTATMDGYEGEAVITIVDTLPYALDKEKMKELAIQKEIDTETEDEWLKQALDGGEYQITGQDEGNPKYTITWTENKTINTETDGNEISVSQNIWLVYADIDTTQKVSSLTNTVTGKIYLNAIDRTYDAEPATHDTKTNFIKSIKVTKTWNHGANVYTKPTEIEIQLKDRNKLEEEPINTYTLKENENWTHTFTELPKYDEDGNEINYTVIEVEDEKTNYYKREDS